MAYDGGDDFFGGIFDFDGDGETDFVEQAAGYMMMEEAEREDDDEDFELDPGWHDNFSDDDLENALDPDLYDGIRERREEIEQAKYAWRDTSIEISQKYGVDPELYETADEFKDAIEVAKHAWRDEHRWDFIDLFNVDIDVDPDDYETEEEYLEALNDALYGWREKHVSDGIDAGVDPEDYETEEEYLEALAEQQATEDEDEESAAPSYEWRKLYDTAAEEYDVDPEDYETEEEFVEDLEEAMDELEAVAWREDCEDGSEYDVDPEDFETEEEYMEALEEAKYAWRLTCEDGSAYNIHPEDYETEAEYMDALDDEQGAPTAEQDDPPPPPPPPPIEPKIEKAAKPKTEKTPKPKGPYAWRRTCYAGRRYGIFADDFETKADYEAAFNKVRYKWRESCEDGSKWNIDPCDYETLAEYQRAIDHCKYAWRNNCVRDSDYGIYPREYETEAEYLHDLHLAQTGWRTTCADGRPYGEDPQKYQDEHSYENALDDAKRKWRLTCKDGKDYYISPSDYQLEEDYRADLEAAKQAWLEDEQNGVEFGVFVRDYPTKELYMRALRLAKHSWQLMREARCREHFAPLDDDLYVPSEALEIDRDAFIRECPNVIAAKYLTSEGEFDYGKAIGAYFATAKWLRESGGTRIDSFLNHMALQDGALAARAWAWCIEQFYPYRHYLKKPTEMLDDVLPHLSTMPKSFLQELFARMREDQRLLHILCTASQSASSAMIYLLYRSLETGDTDLATRMFNEYVDGRFATESSICHVVERCLSFCTADAKSEAMANFAHHLYPLVKALPLCEVQNTRRKWAALMADALDDPTLAEGSDLAPIFSADPSEWRCNYRTEAREVGLSPYDFKSENDYLDALRLKQKAAAEWRRRRGCFNLRTYQTKRDDPLAKKDKTVFKLYNVCFEPGGATYQYLSDDESLQVGDKVMVPVGSNGNEKQVEIVSITQHTRATAPFRIDRTKHILRKCDESKPS